MATSRDWFTSFRERTVSQATPSSWKHRAEVWTHLAAEPMIDPDVNGRISETESLNSRLKTEVRKSLNPRCLYFLGLSGFAFVTLGALGALHS